MAFRRTSGALIAAVAAFALGGLGSGIANSLKAVPAVELFAPNSTRRRESRVGASWSHRRLGKRGWSVAEGKRRSAKRRNRQRHKHNCRGGSR